MAGNPKADFGGTKLLCIHEVRPLAVVSFGYGGQGGNGSGSVSLFPKARFVCPRMQGAV